MVGAVERADLLSFFKVAEAHHTGALAFFELVYGMGRLLKHLLLSLGAKIGLVYWKPLSYELTSTGGQLLLPADAVALPHLGKALNATLLMADKQL